MIGMMMTLALVTTLTKTAAAALVRVMWLLSVEAVMVVVSAVSLVEVERPVTALLLLLH
jgi:hypothetical protein